MQKKYTHENPAPLEPGQKDAVEAIARTCGVICTVAERLLDHWVAEGIVSYEQHPETGRWGIENCGTFRIIFRWQLRWQLVATATLSP